MQVQLVDGDIVNAFVCAFDSDTVFVTREAKKVWTEAELKGVISHEECHANQHHPEIKIAINVLLGVYQMERLIRGRGWKGKYFTPLFVGKVVLNGYSYLIERIADNHAKTQGHGEELASALMKVKVPLWKKVVSAVAVGDLHPSNKSRIKKLLK